MSFVLEFLLGVAHAQGTGIVTINPNIPGSISPNQGPLAVVFNFYQYAMMAAGLLAFASIVYAGVRYSMAQGNPSTQADARDQIWQALLGLIILFGAYIILFTISPDLVRLQLPTLEKIGLVQNVNNTGIIAGGTTRGGSCDPNGGRYCSPDALRAAGCVGNSRCSGDEGLRNLAAVISYDSAGCTALNRESVTDVCEGGNSFSIGLAQINIISEGNSVGGPCRGVVTRVSGAANCPSGAGICLWQGNGQPSQSCVRWVTNSNGFRYCGEYACKIMDSAKYQACKNYLAGSAQVQLQYTCRLFNSRCYNPWANSADRCGL